jgi:tetratricopeptide (TPR) repeat protein
MFEGTNIHKYWIVMVLLLSGCASAGKFLGINHTETYKPIANPFGAYKQGSKSDLAHPMILRTKRGDRAVELELPGESHQLSEFVLPVSPAFKDSGRTIASSQSSYSAASSNPFGNSPEDSQSNGNSLMDESYKSRTPSLSDREITQSFKQNFTEEDGKMREIENGLNLVPAEDGASLEGATSYLAQLDHIKQLYKMTRYEAALIETDEVIKFYPTDPKLYQMRGTLLDRMGRRDLALRAWNQALRFDPNNQGLRKFLERKQAGRIAGAP